jgi:hypothetical protein
MHDLFTQLVSKGLLLRGWLLRGLDQGWLENTGIPVIGRRVRKTSRWLNLIVEQRIRIYLLGGFIFIFLILFLVYKYSLRRVKDWRFLGGYPIYIVLGKSLFYFEKVMFYLNYHERVSLHLTRG